MNPSTYNIVDVIALVLIMCGVIQGMRRGLSGELERLLNAVIAFLIAIKLHAVLANKIAAQGRLSPTASQAVAFVVTLVVAYVVIYGFRLMLQHVMDVTFKERIENVGGAIVGSIRAAFMVSVVVLCVALWSHGYLHRAFAEKSMLGRTLYEHAPRVYGQLAARYPQLPQPPPTEDEQIEETEQKTARRVRGYPGTAQANDIQENH